MRPTAPLPTVLHDSESRLGWALKLLLGLSLLMAVVPLWLSPEDIHDGLFGSARVAMGDTAPMWLLSSEGNLHLFAVYYEMVGWLQARLHVPAWVLYKAFNSACLAWLGWELWCLAQRSLRWDASVAAACVALIWVFPVWSMLFASVQMVLVFVCLALWGHRRIHEGQRSLQVLGWLALVLSFHLGANFAFVMGLEVLRWCARGRGQSWNFWRSSALVVCSVAAYAATRTLATPGGEFVGYNNLMDWRSASAWISLAVGMAKFATFAVLPLAVCAVVLALAIFRHQPRMGADVSRARLWLVLGLAFLAFCASFPYAAVGKSTALFFSATPGTSSMFAQIRLAAGDGGLMSPFGIWSNRFAFLLAVPCVLLAGLALQTLHTRGGERSGVYWLAVLPAWCLSAGMLWQANGTKLDQLAQVPAIVAGLRGLPAPSPGMLDIEYAPVQRFVFPEAHEPNWFAYRAWGERKWMGMMFAKDGGISEKLLRDLNERQYVIRGGNRLRAGIFLADDYPGPICQTRIHLELPAVNRWDMLLGAGFRANAIPAAKADLVSSECPPRVMPRRARSFAEM